ncbi:MAG: DUF3606 domain-containing protein [Alphaproteobacteria bacterium]|nr:DUF3606 domain-containing protein [Alphaproteobacteria bacterium]
MALIAIPVPADPTLVNVRERLEVEYRCQEWGCTEEELLDAVASVGDAAAQAEGVALAGWRPLILVEVPASLKGAFPRSWDAHLLRLGVSIDRRT